VERSSIFASRILSRVSDFSSGSRPVTAQKKPAAASGAGVNA
jgi:hypothetical protein